MKLKRSVIRVFTFVFAMVFVMSFSVNALAVVDDSGLPRVDRWVNGMATASDGSFLYNTWAIDETGVSANKYVLLDENAVEVNRSNEYLGENTVLDVVVCPTYEGNIKLLLPDGVSGEVILTIQNAKALYHVCFNEENGYEAATFFYPGIYSIVSVDVANDIDTKYVLSQDIAIDVSNSDVSAFLEIVKKGEPVTSEAETSVVETEKISTEEVASSTEIEKVSFSSFDRNNDLLSDTLVLFACVAGLLIVYAFIKHKRQKDQEIKRR